MKILLLTSQPYLGFVYEEIIKYLPQNDFSISIRSKPNFGDYDVGVSFMYLYKVPKEQVDSHIWINFHPAPLPEYRGRNLCYHAIMNGEGEFGATVHYMDENFDTGDIIEVLRFPIEPSDTAGDLSRLVLGFSMQLFSKYLPEIIKNSEFTRYRNEGGSYYKKSVVMDTLELPNNSSISQFIRAVTYKCFVPRFIVGGVIYKIVRDE